MDTVETDTVETDAARCYHAFRCIRETTHNWRLGWDCSRILKIAYHG